MNKQTFKKERIAQILVESLFYGINQTAEKYQVTPRIIRRWRSLLEVDVELLELFESKKSLVQQRWVNEAGAFISKGFQYLHQAAESQNVSPEMIHAIAGAMKIASEIVLVREVLDARLSGQSRENNQTD
ncbi:MAG: hypothetical protein QXS68_05850 [Candidatus Methanomethylicaceae archaeon]